MAAVANGHRTTRYDRPDMGEAGALVETAAGRSVEGHYGKGGRFLSVVATARNDGHGGDLLYRMQLFVDALAAQCARHALDAELVLVEWNPPADRPPLIEVLALPAAETLPVRIITVPAEVHATLEHADRLPLFQMIAKNVGIRRAQGRFVLATNVDVLLSDELVGALAGGSLDGNRLYRCDRYDVTADIPASAPIDEQLDLCADRVIRINRYNATVDVRTGEVYPIYPTKLPSSFPLAVVIAIRIFEHAWRKVKQIGRSSVDAARGGLRSIETRSRRGFAVAVRFARAPEDLRPAFTRKFRRVRARARFSLHELWSPRAISARIARLRARPRPEARRQSLLHRTLGRWRRLVADCRAAVEWEQARVMLHTNASGDFTLMSRRCWETVRGYPELQLFSMHLDSLLLYQAHYAGFDERCLTGRVYHLEHLSGFRPNTEAVQALNERLDKAAVPQITMEEFRTLILTMYKLREPIIFNGPDWGFLGEDFAEDGTAPTLGVTAPGVRT
jgi:hypothetical protein